ncbi:MAG TPA: CoA pyrophosphatase [Actinomycetota bacterium]|nr:CoA pyrophosphatase [Actinomycetota bacterium]
MSDIATVLRRALQPADADPDLPEGTPAAVVVPLLDLDEPTLLFTRRTDLVRDHKGEISFPGGVRHADDPDLMTTALRETEEELGIGRDAFEIVGALAPVQTFVSGYVIAPFVGVLARRPTLRPSPVEIEEVLELGVAGLASEERKVVPDGAPPGLPPMYVYEMGGQIVWGATGRIVHGFLEVLREGGWIKKEE